MFILFVPVAWGQTLYVDADAVGTEDGSSWTNAYTTLQSALAAATDGDVIWVAAGVYYPDEGTGQTDNDRASTFQLPTGVMVYGGFDGTDGAGGGAQETMLNQRNGGTHPTTLSGDLQQDDGTAGNSDNAYHVVTSSGAASSTVLDGFIITAGNANGLATHQVGGGLYNAAGSPVLRGNTITGNAAVDGGGLYNNGGSPEITENTISDNTTTGMGGGIYNANGSPTIMSNRITGNTTGGLGGGLYSLNGSPSIVDNTLASNSALDGGGLYILNGSPSVASNNITNNIASNAGGGLYNNTGSGIPIISENNISGNMAIDGGGMYNTSSAPVISENTIAGNMATMRGGGLYNGGGGPMISSNTLTNNSATNGGGIYNDSDSPDVVNNTLVDNMASANGGGIFNSQGSLTILASTITGNSASLDGGGVQNQGSSSPLIRNTILWGNSDSGGASASAQLSNDSATPTISYSIVQGSGGSSSWDSTLGNDGGSNQDEDPLLDALASNGGPTQTRLPSNLSPAIDKGSCFAGSLGTDQRGQLRPIDDPLLANANDGCDIGAVELFGSELLPVELTSFSVLADGARALLTWETASETNNAGFEVQYHAESWQTLTFVQGHGTTTEAKTYTYTTNTLLPGRYRFRLRQIDYDGAFAFSPEEEVVIEIDKAYLMTAAYPNPFNKRTQWSLLVKRAQHVHIGVYDLMGRRVAVLHEGEMASDETLMLVFEAASLASGVYMIRAEGETFRTVELLVLTR